jgi:predicted kinase
LARELNAAVLSVDEITLALFGQHLGEKHDEICERAEGYLFRKAVELTSAGMVVILDWGFWTKKERQKTAKYFSDRKIPVEWHYIDAGGDLRRQNLLKRNEEVANGRNDAYYIDGNIAAKFGRLFEEPAREEIDVWYDNTGKR